MEEKLTQKTLQSYLEYDPETGIFKWLKSHSNSVTIGAVAGGIKSSGYRRIRLLNKLYPEHRLAWLYVYAEFPRDQIDHINHDRSDNRISNLRDVSAQENKQNQNIHLTNTSGVTGVHWDKSKSKWQARIHVDGVRRHLGYFNDKTDAALAREKANKKYGFHKNHGINSPVSLQK